MRSSVENFFSCVREHPSLLEKRGKSAMILLGADNRQEKVARDILRYCPTAQNLSLQYVNLQKQDAQQIKQAMDACDLFIFMYDSSLCADISPHGPEFIRPLKNKMTEHWKKSVLLREYGEYFAEAFSNHIDEITLRNHSIIYAAQQARRVTFLDGLGGGVTGTLAERQAWQSLDGRNHYDLMPGEVATRIVDLNGSLTFAGTFLSTVPFAIKYGVIEPILHLDIVQSRIVSAYSDNKSLQADFNLYLDQCAGNRIVEEFGIGTNVGVNLHGLNASFEERHAGLHLGLGGGERASHHLDLIFSSGEILFDDRLIFDGVFHL
ncbi:leucyl aminopeptidase [Vibrio navarrensis]|uniref:leucyl aminopeptidase n=1 Tax=Vibrio navarrensis TaxID=29495 RepID=UPI00130262A4|nr:leucyl aminopeptidase [Vibrio navarrensis]